MWKDYWVQWLLKDSFISHARGLTKYYITQDKYSKFKSLLTKEMQIQIKTHGITIWATCTCSTTTSWWARTTREIWLDVLQVWAFHKRTARRWFLIWSKKQSLNSTPSKWKALLRNQTEAGRRSNFLRTPLVLARHKMPLSRITHLIRMEIITLILSNKKSKPIKNSLICFLPKRNKNKSNLKPHLTRTSINSTCARFCTPCRAKCPSWWKKWLV